MQSNGTKVTFLKRERAKKKWWTAPYLDDPDLSLLRDLDSKIRNGKEIEGDMAKLLSTIVKGYCEFVKELKKEPWVNKKAVEDDQSQLDLVLSNILNNAR